MVVSPKFRETFRAKMPVTSKFAYLDHAAVAPLPASAGDAISKFANQATHQGDTCWQNWASNLQRTRELAAQLVGANSAEIALVGNTTQGISLVSEGLDWKPGDNLVVPDNEFPSNLLPWRLLSRRGVEVRLAQVGPDGAITADLIRKYLDKRTRLVSASWVGFSSGYRTDLAQLAELIHQNRSLFFVDAIQGLGAFPLDVRNMGIDFLAADGHKWLLGPEGAGLLYLRADLLNQLQPLGVGWNSLSSAGFDPNSVELKQTAARYEGGSSNMVGMMGLRASLELLLEMGCHREDSQIAASILENVFELSTMLESAQFRVSTPETETNRSGIIGIRWPEADAVGESAYLAARQHLLSKDVVASMRAGRLRIATHGYNNADDHQRLIEALCEFRRGQQTR